MVITRPRFPRAVTLAASVTLLASAVFTVGARATAPINEVTNWNRIATQTLIAFPAPAGGAAPATQINMAMTQGAVYDAINSIDPRTEPYLLQTRFEGASKNAAAATAAYLVLSEIIATVPSTIAFANASALQTTLDNAYATSVPDASPPSVIAGIAAGTAAAEAMIAARQGDGRFGASPWVPNSAPGHWQPLLRPDNTPILDPTPWVGGVTPFLMQSSSQFRTDGPNSLASDAWAADFNEVKALGRIDSTVRTPDQTHIALFWQSTPVATWNEVARAITEDPDYGLDVDDSALLFAMINLTAADAAINCWNDKYYWDFWRPWTAIRRAAEDGNPATEPDPTWSALITAPYPEHPSGHLCLDSAYLTVMRRFLHTDKVSFAVTSLAFPGETRSFDRFSRAIKEIIDARIWAGLHFRTADVQSTILGRKVAHYMSMHYFQPLE